MRVIFLCVLAIIATSAPALANPDLAGIIKTVEGQGFILRGTSTLPARRGDTLYVNDTVATEKDGSIGIMLEDDTLVSLGPDSRLELRDFAFAPQKELFSIALRLLKGSFAYVSGVIGRLAPDKVRIETPDAVIATLGTRFVVKVEGAR